MTDDDHDHDPADYDDKNEVEDGDGNVFQYLDLMALKCGVCRQALQQALQRPPRARRQRLKAGEHFLKRSEITPQQKRNQHLRFRS